VYSSLLDLQDWISKIGVRDVTQNVRDVTLGTWHGCMDITNFSYIHQVVATWLCHLLESIINCLLPGNLLSKISQTWHTVSAKSLLAILLFNRRDITARSTNVAVIYNDSVGQELSRVFIHRRLPLLLWCLMDRTSSNGLENSTLKWSHCMRCLLCKCPPQSVNQRVVCEASRITELMQSVIGSGWGNWHTAFIFAYVLN